MDNILRHDLCIFADAIRAAGAEAKQTGSAVRNKFSGTQSARRALRQRVPFVKHSFQFCDAIRAAGAEAKETFNRNHRELGLDAIRASGAESSCFDSRRLYPYLF